MPIRRYPQYYRRRPSWDPRTYQKTDAPEKASEPVETVNIPLPNIPEEGSVAVEASPRKNRPRSVFDFLNGFIHTEEIIILGLILLLFIEGIEDELLLLLLVYILLA